MDENQIEALRYPIGKYEIPETISDETLAAWLKRLEEYPRILSRLVEGLSRSQLDTPYREGGWTVRQVVHHLADSHHNSYLRFKWALTEENPVVKVYDEKAFAALEDSRKGPINLSLDHLAAVHARLVYLLRSLSGQQLERSWVHPVKEQEYTLRETVGQYVWHGNHHYSHIRNLLVREGWS